MIIRIISSKNASSAPQNLDLLQQTLDLSLKIVENTGVEGIYPFPLKLIYQTSCIIKLISRPRMEEQFQIIKRVTDRILYEITHIGKPYTYCTTEASSEDISHKDNQQVIKMLLQILGDLIARDCKLPKSFIHFRTKPRDVKEDLRGEGS
jgi:hypothetical protein